MSLSLLPGDIVQNGPERSRARRCWARRSRPLTARTVLGRWVQRERLGEISAKTGGTKVAPSPGATNTRTVAKLAARSVLVPPTPNGRRIAGRAQITILHAH